MMFHSEAYRLKVGQRFSFSDHETPTEIVTDTDIIDYEGHPLVLYSDEQGLHGHYRDHTEVWVDQ